MGVVISKKGRIRNSRRVEAVAVAKSAALVAASGAGVAVAAAG